jgi:hypothetical protein
VQTPSGPGTAGGAETRGWVWIERLIECVARCGMLGCAALLMVRGRYVRQVEDVRGLRSAPLLAPLLQQLREHGDEPVLPAAAADPRAASVMTIHRAQGLEVRCMPPAATACLTPPAQFDTVVLVSAVDRKLPGFFRLPEFTVPTELVPHALQTREQQIEARTAVRALVIKRGGGTDERRTQSERRLAYVAMTRARRRFVFTSADPSAPSRFVGEALGHHTTVVPEQPDPRRTARTCSSCSSRAAPLKQRPGARGRDAADIGGGSRPALPSSCSGSSSSSGGLGAAAAVVLAHRYVHGVPAAVPVPLRAGHAKHGVCCAGEPRVRRHRER